MEKEILQNELPILEEMLALMTEQQELILDITAELQTANQDLAQAEKGQTDQFAAVIGASIERRKRTIDEALERRKEIYERFERLQRLRSAGNAGADGANAGGTDGKDTDHTSIRERTTAASDLIRMAERAGADARANDAASGAVIKDSQTGRAYREAERERQDSERQRKIKARKRGIDR